MTYVCDCCGYKTDEPEVVEQRHPYGDTYASEYFLDYCRCGGEMKEGKSCPICGEYHAGEYEVCDECLEESAKNVSNLKKYSTERNLADIPVKIPNYLFSVLGEEVILDLAFIELRDHFKDYEDKVKAYIDEDRFDFAEWLKEREKEIA